MPSISFWLLHISSNTGASFKTAALVRIPDFNFEYMSSKDSKVSHTLREDDVTAQNDKLIPCHSHDWHNSKMHCMTSDMLFNINDPSQTRSLQTQDVTFDWFVQISWSLHDLITQPGRTLWPYHMSLWRDPITWSCDLPAGTRRGQLVHFCWHRLHSVFHVTGLLSRVHRLSVNKTIMERYYQRVGHIPESMKTLISIMT